jgi:taurine dioxygenase
MSLAADLSTPVIGATIDLDLSRLFDLNSRELTIAVDEVYAALLEHQVLFFEDQQLTPEQQLSLAKNFGSPDLPHPVYQKLVNFPEIVELENDGTRLPDTNDWHTDLTFRQHPPFMSILYAREVPQTGGDTLWANMYAAYDALPDGMKSMLSSLDAIHDMGTFRNDYLGDCLDTDAVGKALQELGSAVHPITPLHPVTNRRYLFVNQSFTQHIVGMLKTESDRLLSYLYNHTNRPEFQVRYRWKNGSLVMWENRITQHYAVADYLPHYRRMHRVTVNTDRRVESAIKADGQQE